VLQSKGVPLSPVRLALLSCRRGASPKCTGGQYQNTSATSTSYLRGFPNVNQGDNGIAKIDYHIKARHTVSGVLLMGNYTGVGEDHAFVNQGFLDTPRSGLGSNVDSWIWLPSSGTQPLSHGCRSSLVTPTCMASTTVPSIVLG
jgi:hypothetical protein